ncbi:MAG: septum formation initiator family protein [Candidatus Daviesbacteria bacterium]|nr:septum formation initiator family protein [Candidatus Daviesbacteria bacterium]
MLKKLILGLIIIIVLIIAYNLVRQIMESVKSGERLSESAEAVYKLEIKNRVLKEKLSQIKSQDFLEEEIRNRLGFAKAGETVVVIPDDKLKLVLGVNSPAQIRLPNWLGWVKLFWH